MILILATTLAHNGSAVLFAAESRRHPPGPWLLLAVSRRAPGVLAVFLNVVGWALEIAALTLVSLTLTRVVNVAGLALVLVLSRWALRERVGRRELAGVCVLVLGTLAASAAAPERAGSSSSPALWLLILALSLPVLLLPNVLRAFGIPRWPVLAAMVAGFAYALSSVLNKGLADALSTAAYHFVLLVTLAAVTVGFWGFVVELDALQAGRAAVVIPVVMALHTVVPIACAPFLFGEALPGGTAERLLLGGGVLATLVGLCVVAVPSPRDEERRKLPKRDGLEEKE